MSRNRLNLNELPTASLRAVLALLKETRRCATYECASMSLAGAVGAELADLACPRKGWLWLACSLLVLGLMCLAGALVRTIRRFQRRKCRRRGTTVGPCRDRSSLCGLSVLDPCQQCGLACCASQLGGDRCHKGRRLSTQYTASELKTETCYGSRHT
jgi:hypothetical protein